MEKPAYILDNGSNTQKCGLSGKDEPQALFPSRVGYLRNDTYNNSYIGDEAVSSVSRWSPTFRHPVQDQLVRDWEEVEKLWRHGFENQMQLNLSGDDDADPDVTGVMLTMPSWGPKDNRERACQVWFESLNAPRFYVVDSAVLSLYASGHTLTPTLALNSTSTRFLPHTHCSPTCSVAPSPYPNITSTLTLT